MDLPSTPLHLTIIVSQDLARCYAGAAGAFKNHRSQPCRREVDEILNASLFMIYPALDSAFKNRKRVEKIKHIA